MDKRHLAVFVAAAMVGAVTSFPRASRAWWAEFQAGDNLADNSSMPRYHMTWMTVRYSDEFGVSSGSNVGFRGCSHGYTSFVFNCAPWTYAPPTPLPVTPSTAIQNLSLSSTGLARLADVNAFNYVEYLRMGPTASATTVRIQTTLYGN